MKRKWFFSVCLLVVASALFGVVSVSALGGYSLDWWTVDGGGAISSTGGNYSLGGSIGQPDAGTSTGGTYALTGGFWGGDTDVIPPTVVSSLLANLNPTNLASVNFTVTFSEAVTGVDVGDFSLTTSGITSATVSGVSGSGSGYTVAVNTGSGNGTVRLDVRNNATVADLVGNPLAGLPYTSGDNYSVDKTAPTVVHIIRANLNPTKAASVNFTVTFSEAVTGVDVGDFSLTTTGITGATVSGVSGSGSDYTVAVNTGSGAGTIRLNIVDNDTIVDLALNPLGGVGAGNGSYTSGEKYDVRFYTTYIPRVAK